MKDLGSRFPALVGLPTKYETFGVATLEAGARCGHKHGPAHTVSRVAIWRKYEGFGGNTLPSPALCRAGNKSVGPNQGWAVHYEKVRKPIGSGVRQLWENRGGAWHSRYKYEG